jgi:hypothetical protein
MTQITMTVFPDRIEISEEYEADSILRATYEPAEIGRARSKWSHVAHMHDVPFIEETHS